MDPEEQPQAGAPPGDEATSEPTSELRADETVKLPPPPASPTADPPPSPASSTAATDELEDDDYEEDWEDEEPRGHSVPLLGAILLGFVTLLIGLAAGFYIAGGVNGTALLTLAPTPTPRPTPTLSPDQQQQREQVKQIVAMLVSKTRHFKGNANAPVTILEFSDFQ